MIRRSRRGPVNGTPNSGSIPGKSNNVSRLVNQRVNALLNGRSFRPTLMPPTFSTQPWNTVIIRHQVNLSPGFTTVTHTQLVAALAKQCGLYSKTGTETKDINIELRYLSVSAWLLTESIGFLRLLPLDLATAHYSSKTSEMANVDSMGQKNMYPASGYVWPSSQQNLTWLSENKQSVIILDGTPSNICELHVKVLWRGAEGSDIQLIPTSVPRRKPARPQTTEGSVEDLSNFEDLDI